MTRIGNTILLIFGMAIAMQAVTAVYHGLSCLNENGFRFDCHDRSTECHIVVDTGNISSPIVGCGETLYSSAIDHRLGCRRVNSYLVYCACNTDTCNTFASTEKFLRDERQAKAEAEAIAKAEDEANAKLEIEAEKLENEKKQQEELKNQMYKKRLEESNMAMISAIVERKPIDIQEFMTSMYLKFYFDEKKEKKN